MTGMDNRNSLMFGDSPKAQAFRHEQACVDSEIEGMSRDPETAAFLARLDAENLSFEERKARLDAYFNAKYPPQNTADIAAAE